MTSERYLKVTGWGPFRLPGERQRMKAAYKRASGVLALLSEVPDEVEDSPTHPADQHSSTRSAKFEIYNDAKGEFRFRLKAGNGEIVATGEGYTTRIGVINGVDAGKRAAAEAEVDDKTDEQANPIFTFE